MDNTFHIYTTGIINWGSFEDPGQNLINAWNNGVRELIIRKIPDGFNIKLHHFDPILEISSNGPIKKTDQNRENYINYANENLIPSDLGNQRVIITNFIDEELDIENIQNPHLIIDLGHIFKYPHIKYTVILGGNYGGSIGEPIKLNALRTGFLGNGFGSLLSLADTIRVNKYGNVETYVDLMISKGYNYDENNPSSFIENIYHKLILNIENSVKNLKDNAPLFRVEHIIKKILPDTTSLLNSILVRLWNDFKPDRLISEITNNLVQLKIDIITTMDLQ